MIQNLQFYKESSLNIIKKVIQIDINEEKMYSIFTCYK